MNAALRSRLARFRFRPDFGLVDGDRRPAGTSHHQKSLTNQLQKGGQRMVVTLDNSDNWTRPRGIVDFAGSQRSGKSPSATGRVASDGSETSRASGRILDGIQRLILPDTDLEWNK